MGHLTRLEILGLEHVALEEIVQLKLMNTQTVTTSVRWNFSNGASPVDLNEAKCNCECDDLGPKRRKSI